MSLGPHSIISLKYKFNGVSGHPRLLGDADGDDGDLLHPNSNHSTATKSHQSPRLLYAQATGIYYFSLAVSQSTCVLAPYLLTQVVILIMTSSRVWMYGYNPYVAIIAFQTYLILRYGPNAMPTVMTSILSTVARVRNFSDRLREFMCDVTRC